MNRQHCMDQIIEQLAVLSRKVELKSCLNLTDLNVHAESFYRDFLNLVFGYRLENINAFEPNAVAIDLGDKDLNQIAIQVTSTSGQSKVKKTIESFIARELAKDYKKLVIFNLVKKVKSSQAFVKSVRQLAECGVTLEVWDIKDLVTKINDMPLALLKEIKNFLADELSNEDAHLSIPRSFRAELDDLLVNANLTTKFVQQTFFQSMQLIEPYPVYHNCPPIDADLTSHLDFLFDELGFLHSANIKAPMLEFVNRLAQQASNKTALLQWVQKIIRHIEPLHLGEQYLASIGKNKYDKQLEKPPYLMIEIAEQNKNIATYRVEAWLLDRRAAQTCLADWENVRLEQMPHILSSIFALKSVLAVCNAKQAKYLLTVEYFLPTALLHNTVPADWRLADCDADEPPVSFYYPAVVRVQERMQHNAFNAKWINHWQDAEDKRIKEPTFEHFEWIDSNNEFFPATRINDGTLLFALTFIPDKKCLHKMIRAGVATALWSNQQVCSQTVQLFYDKIKTKPLDELPELLYQFRQYLWELNEEGAVDGPVGCFNLLWDDPDRNPILDDYDLEFL